MSKHIKKILDLTGGFVPPPSICEIVAMHMGKYELDDDDEDEEIKEKPIESTYNKKELPKKIINKKDNDREE